mgnify:CR=1 FL=1
MYRELLLNGKFEEAKEEGGGGIGHRPMDKSVKGATHLPNLCQNIDKHK